jgi:hypothetical protein
MTAQTFSSGGLGLERSEWERLYGLPGRIDAGFSEYQHGSLVVTFRDDRVRYLQHVWGDDQPVMLEEARRLSRMVIPTDSVLLRTYVARQGRIVDLYRSDSLHARFSSTTWLGSDPGTLQVRYWARPDQRVTSITVVAGGTSDAGELTDE